MTTETSNIILDMTYTFLITSIGWTFYMRHVVGQWQEICNRYSRLWKNTIEMSNILREANNLLREENKYLAKSHQDIVKKIEEVNNGTN